MPRPLVPQEGARITGADVKGSACFSSRSDPKTTPLGDPSDWMGGEPRVASNSFRAEVPWLMESDRVLVEMAACIRARLMTGEEVGVRALNQLHVRGADRCDP